tara:strand:+ start:456 stop:680 length:225 start_codon:yes stop_codon:yes gene_type:complete
MIDVRDLDLEVFSMLFTTEYPKDMEVTDEVGDEIDVLAEQLDWAYMTDNFDLDSLVETLAIALKGLGIHTTIVQ